jgi:putative ABC transport system ATP-binding protein
MQEGSALEPWLATHGLKRHYQRGPQVVKALDGVDIALVRGDFLAVVGASGSGKSTLLNLIAGLDTPSAGRIEIDGAVLGTMSRRELAAYRAKRVGMIFQSFNLLHQRSALENVELGLYFNDTPPRERRRRAAAILDRLGLADRMDHHPADLSGGEQQRVAIARALVKKPELLLADEPTGNLDRENAREIAAILAELNREGHTLVMSTHDRELAQAWAHRLVRLDYGRIAPASEEAP